jgi:DNA-binding NarL/FixJ family response regulator
MKAKERRSVGVNALDLKGMVTWRRCGEQRAVLRTGTTPRLKLKEATKNRMINLNDIKITPRDQQVLRLLVQGCSNKEIAGHLNISPRTVKQHLRTLFLRAGIKEGRKRVKLATAMFIKEQMQPCSPVIG